MKTVLFFVIVFAVLLQYVAMPGRRCVRCDKYCTSRKVTTHVGKTGYIRTFLKTEKGLTENELDDAETIVCNACRTFIYNQVFRPEHCKSRSGSKRSLEETDSATQAAVNVVAKKLKENEKFHSSSTRRGKYSFMYFLTKMSCHIVYEPLNMLKEPFLCPSNPFFLLSIRHQIIMSMSHLRSHLSVPRIPSFFCQPGIK